MPGWCRSSRFRRLSDTRVGSGSLDRERIGAGRRSPDGLDGRGEAPGGDRRSGRPATATGDRDGPPFAQDVPLSRSRHGGQDVNQAGRGCDRTLAGVQGTPHHALAEPAGRALPAPGQVQRRAHLAAPARRGRTRRPDQRRRLRPDGRHRRLRPRPRRQVRDLLRAAHPRGHARRAAHDGLGAAAGPQQGAPRWRRPARRSKPQLGRPPDRRGTGRAARHPASRSSRRWPATPPPSASSA